MVRYRHLILPAPVNRWWIRNRKQEIKHGGGDSQQAVNGDGKPGRKKGRCGAKRNERKKKDDDGDDGDDSVDVKRGVGKRTDLRCGRLEMEEERKRSDHVFGPRPSPPASPGHSLPGFFFSHTRCRAKIVSNPHIPTFSFFFVVPLFLLLAIPNLPECPIHPFQNPDTNLNPVPPSSFLFYFLSSFSKGSSFFVEKDRHTPPTSSLGHSIKNIKGRIKKKELAYCFLFVVFRLPFL